MLPPAVDIDHGISGGGEDFAGADHIRLAEENDAVAIRMRVGDMDDLHAFVVEVDVLFVAEVGVGRPCRRGSGGLRSAGRAHPVQDVLMRDDLRAFRRILDVGRNVSAGDGAARLAQWLVAARVIGMHAACRRCSGSGLSKWCGSQPGSCRPAAPYIVSTRNTPSLPACTVICCRPARRACIRCPAREERGFPLAKF